MSNFDVITSKWRRLDVLTTSLLRDVSAGGDSQYISVIWNWMHVIHLAPVK